MADWQEVYKEDNEDKKNLARLVVAICEGDPTKSGRVIGTGFLTGPNTVATAEHVLNGREITLLRCVFYYYLASEGQAGFPDRETYEIDTKLPKSSDDDWVLLRLKDSPGPDHLEVNDSGGVSDTDKMFVIGHPNGDPGKISGDCKVVTIQDESFDIDLPPKDSASGAPVFNATSLKVEGMLVAGVKQSECLKASLFC